MGPWFITENPKHELPRTPLWRSSENPQKAKFAEFLFHALG
jgi:hypothetical protein